MSCKYVHILPVVCASWFFLTFIITYIISVLKKDVTAVFPYISDTGTWSPESCIFGFMLNIGALMQAVIIYIRYRQVKYLLDKETTLPQSAKRDNRISYVLGVLAGLGVCIVGNFQETNAFIVHVFGAFLAFGFGSIYQSLQTRLSFQISPFSGRRDVNIARIVLTAISSVSSLLTCGFFGVSYLQFTGDDFTKWTKNDGGYVNHLVGVAGEWILVTATMTFVLSFAVEFREISVSEPLLGEKQDLSNK